MDYRIEKQAAYVLHTRPYRDTSALVDLFTLEYGKISAVSRGLRRPNSKMKAAVQAFTPLHVNWQGRNDLKTLTLVESTGHIGLLSGNALMCALYANELLQKLLPFFDPYPKLFVYYQYLIGALAAQDIEIPLRIFERKLLIELGYHADLDQIDAQFIYYFNPSQLVFEKVVTIQEQYKSHYFLGEHLIAINNDQYDSRDIRLSAKRLMRLQIDRLLNGATLNTRELFKAKVKK